MDILKIIITAAIAAFPLKLLEEAYRKKIAKESGLEPDSFEVLKKECLLILKRVTALIMIIVPTYGWFIQSTNNYGKWLENVNGLFTDLAKFFLIKVLPAAGLVTIPILFALLISVLLSDGKRSSVTKEIWRFAKKCLKVCGFISIMSALLIELACLSNEGSKEMLKFFSSITFEDCFAYLYVAAVLGSVLGTVLMTYLCAIRLKEIVRDFKEVIARRKAAKAAKKDN